MVETGEEYLVEDPVAYSRRVRGMIEPREIRVIRTRQENVDVVEAAANGAAVRDVDIDVLEELIEEDVLLFVPPEEDEAEE